MSSEEGGISGLLARVRDSLESPRLIGESGSRWRYQKLQWWVVLWRLLTERFLQLESQSTDIKNRLRAILNGLDKRQSF